MVVTLHLSNSFTQRNHNDTLNVLYIFLTTILLIFYLQWNDTSKTTGLDEAPAGTSFRKLKTTENMLLVKHKMLRSNQSKKSLGILK